MFFSSQIHMICIKAEYASCHSRLEAAHCAILLAHALTIPQDAFGGDKSRKTELLDNNSTIPTPMKF